MKQRRRSILVSSIVIACVVAGLSGCGSASRRPVSVKSWQSDVQTYVTESGNGDMNVLRSVEIAPNRPGFSVFSSDRPEESTDIAGVLVGATEYGGSLWYIYLVGEMKQEQVQEIHAAAVAQSGRQYTWRHGERDAAAFAMYRERLDREWRAANPGRQDPPRGALRFPSRADAFEWQAMGDMITVRERASDAEWHVDLTGEARRSN